MCVKFFSDGVLFSSLCIFWCCSHYDVFYRAVYAVVVCLCVCLSHSGIVSKRLNVGSRK